VFLFSVGRLSVATGWRFFSQNMKTPFKIKHRLLACALVAAPCIASLASPAAGTAAGFVDPLDTPAAASALASRGLINGLALAGTRLVAVGPRGHIVYSDDHGKRWTQALVPVSSDLVAVQFPTPRQGWAVGHDGVVLHSEDGGADWSLQLDGRAAARLLRDYVKADANANDAQRAEARRVSAQGPDKPFLDVCFEDGRQGFVVGAFNLIFHTGDGGKSWQPWNDRIDNPGGLHLNAIRVIGDDVFIAGEQGLLLRLDRVKQRFETMPTPYCGSYFGLIGQNGALVAYGLRGNAYRSMDRGQSWRKIETGVQLGLTAATLTTDGRMVLVSQAGQLLVSDDAGASFHLQNPAASGPAFAVVADQDQLMLGGLHGMRRQTLVPQ
jgi:photosystem II stability/assembly factor-like uncharacterized protein